MKHYAFYLLPMLVLGALLTVSCQKAEMDLEQREPVTSAVGNKYKVSLKASNAPDDALSKALDLTDKTLTPYWEVGEQVNVHFAEDWGQEGYIFTVCEIGTLSVVEVYEMYDGRYARLEGEVELTDFMLSEVAGYPSDCYLFLCTHEYPMDWTGQDGTLETIANRYDYATSWCHIESIDESQKTIQLDGFALFETEQPIFKISLFDKAGNPVYPSRVDLSSVGTDNNPGFLQQFSYVVLNEDYTYSQSIYEWGDITVTPSVQTNEFFVALGIHDTDLQSFTITAYVDGKEFSSYVKNDFSIAKGRYYSVNVKLPVVDLSLLEDDYVAGDGETLFGNAGDHVITIPDGATITLFNAQIYAPDGKAAITCEGNATIKSCGTANTVQGGTDCAAIATATTGTTLTLSGSANLEVNGGQNAAGIGAGKDESVGKVSVIYDCEEDVITEICGGDNGAGIGGGLVTTSGVSLGNINVGHNGAANSILVVRGGDNAAGIGSGYASGIYQVSAGNIYVEIVKRDNLLDVFGGDFGAGIGSGFANSIGNIEVIGGYYGSDHAEIAVGGGKYAAGIGCGRGTDSDNQAPSTCGNISITIYPISDAHINVSSYYDYSDSQGRHYASAGSPGVGAGFNGSSCGDISIICLGSLVISGSAAADIGTSYSNNANYSSTCRNIKITDNDGILFWNDERLFEKVAIDGSSVEDIESGVSGTFVPDVVIKYNVGPTAFADPAPATFYPGVMTGQVTIDGDYASNYITDDGIGYYFYYTD